MKVILLKDVKSLGELGDEIEVKDGYARNYLIPRNLVIKSTSGALKVLEQKRMEKERRDRKIKEECEKLAEKITGMSCTISMEAGEDDNLFGSVTQEQISECLEAEGITIDKKTVIIEEPIKVLGVYNVDIALHKEVRPQVRIWVVKK